MPPIENGFDEGWSEQGESQDAADVGLVDLLGGGKLRNGRIFSLLKHAPPAVRASNRLHHRVVDARPRWLPRARAVRGKHDLAAAPSAYPQRNVDRQRRRRRGAARSSTTFLRLQLAVCREGISPGLSDPG